MFNSDNLHKHHAPWRIDITKNHGSLSPEIYESNALDSIRSQRPRRLILSACDYNFFKLHCQNLIDYERSSCQIIYALGVFSTREESKLTAEKLKKFRIKNNLHKFHPFVYGNSNLEWILSEQDSSEIQWDYKINYIRCSRYNLVKKVWKVLAIPLEIESSLRDASTYIIDFDNEIRGDINHIIKKEYPTKSLILSWDSNKSARSDFTKTLSSCFIKGNSLTSNQPYKTVKAGFTAIAPSPTGDVFLSLFETYSIGDVDSFFYMRLFSFYFSDQVSILHAIRDIYLYEIYKKNVSWIDMNTSNIINLRSDLAQYMWCPKGNFQGTS